MRTLVIGLILAVSIMMVGCEDSDTSYKFINNSSYKVTINPNGQTWVPAIISPGHTVTIEWEGTIQYRFSPSNKVRVADNEPGVIVFVNK